MLKTTYGCLFLNSKSLRDIQWVKYEVFLYKDSVVNSYICNSAVVVRVTLSALGILCFL